MKETLSFPSGWLFKQPEIQKMMEDSRKPKEEERPLEPHEPAPFSLNEHDWNEYVKKRDKAREYAKKNDLPGTF